MALFHVVAWPTDSNTAVAVRLDPPTCTRREGSATPKPRTLIGRQQPGPHSLTTPYTVCVNTVKPRLLCREHGVTSAAKKTIRKKK